MLNDDDFWLTEREMEEVVLSDNTHQTSENTSMVFKDDYESSLFLENKITCMPYFDRISNLDRGWLNDLFALDLGQDYNVSLNDIEKSFNHHRQDHI